MSRLAKIQKKREPIIYMHQECFSKNVEKEKEPVDITSPYVLQTRVERDSIFKTRI